MAIELTNIDELDAKIIGLLAADGRMAFSEIGRQVNLSRSAVRDRVMALQEKGVIEKFTCIINPRKVGYGLSVFFEIECIPNKLIDAANKLVEYGEIQSCNQMSGKSLLHAHGAFRDTSHLENFLFKVVYSLPGVSSVQTSILLRGIKTKMGGFKIN